MKRRWIVLVVTVTFLIFHAGMGSPNTRPVHEKVDITPSNTLSAQEESIISSVAAKVLLNIADARGYIQEKKADKAVKSLGKAEELITIIRNSLPTMKVKDHICAAIKHLDYEDTKEVISDLMPIFVSLNEIKDVVSVSEARVHLKIAKKALRSGDKETAKRELMKASNSLIYTEVDLPVSETERNILSAKKYLAQNKLKEASEDLKCAEQDTEFISVKSSEPIIKGRRSLWCATKDYAAGRYAATKADLKKANIYLKQAAKNGDEKTRQEADKLEKDVKRLEGSLREKTEATGSKITSLWERIKALTEREVERILSDWQRFRSRSNVRADLVEAKLHLTYAESYQITIGDFIKTQEDLKVCNEYMQEAIKDASPQTKVKIDAIAKEINQIKMNYKNRSKEMRDQYKKVESDLTDLIGALELR